MAGSKRDQAKMEKIAADMVQSFAHAGNEAFETCLKDLNVMLRSNEPLVWRLSAIMKNPALVALMDGSLTAEQRQGEENEPPLKKRKVRQSMKRFKHLHVTPTLVWDALRKLEASIFEPGQTHVLLCPPSVRRVARYK